MITCIIQRIVRHVGTPTQGKDEREKKMKKIIIKIINIPGRILCLLNFHDWVYGDTLDYYNTDQKIGCLRYGCDA